MDKREIVNREYWIKRVTQREQSFNNDTKKVIKDIEKYYLEVEREIEKEISYLFKKMDGDNSAVAINKYNSILKQINDTITDLYNVNVKSIEKHLKDVYISNYLALNNDFKNGNISVAFDMLPQKFIEESVRTNWIGANFKERQGIDNNKLAHEVHDNITKGIIRGDGINTISKAVSERVGVSLSRAKALIRTETTFVITESTRKNYLDNNIQEYEFLAFLDSKTSDICRNNDGEIFKVSEGMSGVNLPPLHTNCRSCIIPVINRIDLIGSKETKKEQPLKDAQNTAKTIPNTVEGIAKYLKDNHGIEFNNKMGSLKPDAKAFKEIAEFMDFITSRFPGLKNYPYKFKEITFEQDSRAVAFFLRSKGSIGLTKKYYTDYEKLKATVDDDGWSPRGMSANYVFIHEYGHFINTLIQYEKETKMLEKKELRNRQHDIFVSAKEYKKITMYEMKKQDKSVRYSDIPNLLCRYATKNDAEFFAEAYGEFYGSKNPRPLAKIFGEIMEKDLTEILKKYE